jgi:mannose/fructose/N-acetylgalactosamine-specific phosphotransferase system component IIC
MKTVFHRAKLLLVFCLVFLSGIAACLFTWALSLPLAWGCVLGTVLGGVTASVFMHRWTLWHFECGTGRARKL